MAYTLWLTGLPCSGKTTIAKELVKKIDAYHINGDEARRALTKDLGFSEEDRYENLRRVAEVCRILNKAGVDVVATFISPTEQARGMVKDIIEGYSDFILVHIKCPLEVCENRDVKGMYAKARRGEIKEFTGVSAPYEDPKNPDLVVGTSSETIDQSVNEILNYLRNENILKEEGGKYTLFIGRYSPPHKGHKYLFDTVLNPGGRVAIAVRETPLSKQDPLTVEQRLLLLNTLYKEETKGWNPRVRIFSIPNIDEVCVGRGLGYRIAAVPDKIREVSATEVRKGKWDDMPEEIRELVEKFMNKEDY